MNTRQMKNEVVFGLHLIMSLGAYLIPFLITWKLVVPVLLLTVAQHIIFGRCLLMSGHGVSEEDGSTFYSHVLERLGFKPNKKAIRWFVRKILYTALAAVALYWQVYLGNAPIWF